MILFVVVINAQSKALDVDELRYIKDIMYSYLFPNLLVIGLCTSSGLYLYTSVSDREGKLR